MPTRKNGPADAELTSPVATRTRSGRALRTPRAKKQVEKEEEEEEKKVEEEENLGGRTEPEEEKESQASAESSVPLTPGKNEDEEKHADVTEPMDVTSARAPSTDMVRMVPLGKPKSGRVWKDRNKQRFSALLRDKPLRSSWQKKMEAKQEKEMLKKYQQQLKEQKAREKEEKRKRREENVKRRAENERKAEIVQVIRNTAKIKRMKKKELRKIEKRDTLSVLQKTPPAVKKGAK